MTVKPNWVHQRAVHLQNLKMSALFFIYRDDCYLLIVFCNEVSDSLFQSHSQRDRFSTFFRSHHCFIRVCAELKELRGVIQKDLELYPSSFDASPPAPSPLPLKELRNRFRLVCFTATTESSRKMTFFYLFLK